MNTHKPTSKSIPALAADFHRKRYEYLLAVSRELPNDHPERMAKKGMSLAAKARRATNIYLAANDRLREAVAKDPEWTISGRDQVDFKLEPTEIVRQWEEMVKGIKETSSR